MVLLIIDVMLVNRLFPLDVVDATLLGQVEIRDFAAVGETLLVEGAVVVVVLFVFRCDLGVGNCFRDERVGLVWWRQIAPVGGWSLRR